jgi:hypothetical protein
MLSGNASNTAEKMQDFDVNCFGYAMWMMQQPTQEWLWYGHYAVGGDWFSNERALSRRVIRLCASAVTGDTRIQSEVVDSAW